MCKRSFETLWRTKSVRTTDIDWRSQNLRHIYPGMEIPFLGIQVFPVIKIIMILLGAYELQFKHEVKHAWNAAWHVKIVDAFCLRLFLRVWSAKTWIPPIGAPWLTMPLHDGQHRSYGISGSPFYICGENWKQKCKDTRLWQIFLKRKPSGAAWSCESFARSCPTFNPKFIVVEKLLVEPLTTSL